MSGIRLFESEWYDNAREVVCGEWSESAAQALLDGDGPGLVDQAWTVACGVDLPGIAVPEQHGGSGLDLAAAVEVAAAAGAGLFPTRLPFEALLPSLVASRLPPGGAVTGLLAEITGGTPVAVGVVEPGDDGHERLAFVHGLPSADQCLVLRPSQVSLVKRAELAELIALAVMDGRDIGTARVPDGAGTLLAEGATAERAASEARWLGALLAAADALGAATAALDRAIDYASQRHQFGVPIGSFQAVKHAVVDRFLELQVARALLTGAVENDHIDPVGAAMAKAATNEAAVDAAHCAIQVHGAIGVTVELGLHLYQRRVLVDRQLFAGTGACLSVVRGSLGIAHRADPVPTGRTAS